MTSGPGPFAVGESAATAAVRPDGSRRVRLRLWYPAPSPGRDQPFAPVATPSPAVVFGHGYLAPVALYASTLAHLASHGFVVVAPESERRPVPSHAALAADLTGALDWLAEGAPGAPGLSGAVDPERLGLAGHSMGAGCAVLAAAVHPAARSVATLAAAETRPSAIEAASRLRVPIQLVAAERDAVAPVDAHQRPIFDAVRDGTPAQLRIIRGGSHGAFVDSLGPFEPLVRSRRVLPRAGQLELVRELLVSWFQLTLDGRSELWDAVWGLTATERTDVTLAARSAPPRPDHVGG